MSSIFVTHMTDIHRIDSQSYAVQPPSPNDPLPLTPSPTAMHVHTSPPPSLTSSVSTVSTESSPTNAAQSSDNFDYRRERRLLVDVPTANVSLPNTFSSPPSKITTAEVITEASTVVTFEEVVTTVTTDAVMEVSSLPEHQFPATHFGRTAWMTPSQAKAESKKLKGYRWLPINPPAISQIQETTTITQRAIEAKRQRKSKESEVVTIDEYTTSSKSSKTSGVSSPNRTSNKKRKPNVEEELDLTGNEGVQSKEEVMRALELRLEQLRNDPSSTVLPAVAQFPPLPSPVSKKRRSTTAPSPKPRQPNVYTPMPLGTPTNIKPYEYPALSPLLHSHNKSTPLPSPTTTSKGRSVKAPTPYTADEPAHLSQALRRCTSLVNHLMQDKSQMGIFNQPVNYLDPAQLYFAPNYLEIIQQSPMDLGTLKANLTSGLYGSIEAFAMDLRLIWQNAMKYNPVGDWIHNVASQLSVWSENELSRINSMNDRHHQKKGKKKLAAMKEAVASTNGISANMDQLIQMQQRIAALESQLQQSSTKTARPRKSNPGGLQRQSSSARQSSGGGRPSTSLTQAFLKQRPLSDAEKFMLKDDIFKLPPTKLGAVVEIIRASMTEEERAIQAASDDDMEIDILKLDVQTLRELQDYVKKALTSLKRKGAPAGFKRMSASPSATVASSPTTASSSHQISPNQLSPTVYGNVTLGGSSSKSANVSPYMKNDESALKYSSDEDSSDSSASDDDNDDHLSSRSAYPSSQPSPSHVNSTPYTNMKPPTLLPILSTDNTEDENVDTTHWSSLNEASIVNTSSNTVVGSNSHNSSGAWNEFQSHDAELKARARERSEIESRRQAELAAEALALKAAADERTRSIIEARERDAAERELANELRRKHLEAEREAIRRKREEETAMSESFTDTRSEFERFESLHH